MIFIIPVIKTEETAILFQMRLIRRSAGPVSVASLLKPLCRSQIQTVVLCEDAGLALAGALPFGTEKLLAVFALSAG